MVLARRFPPRAGMGRRVKRHIMASAILNVETIITSWRLTLGAYEGFWSFSRASATRG